MDIDSVSGISWIQYNIESYLLYTLTYTTVPTKISLQYMYIIP